MEKLLETNNGVYKDIMLDVFKYLPPYVIVPLSCVSKVFHSYHAPTMGEIDVYLSEMIRDNSCYLPYCKTAILKRIEDGDYKVLIQSGTYNLLRCWTSTVSIDLTKFLIDLLKYGSEEQFRVARKEIIDKLTDDKVLDLVIEYERYDILDLLDQSNTQWKLTYVRKFAVSVKLGKMEITKYMIEKYGLDIDTIDMRLAIEYRQVDFVKKFVELGCTVKGSWVISAFEFCPELVDWLFEKYIEGSNKSEYVDSYVFKTAKLHKHRNIIRYYQSSSCILF